MSKSTVKSDDGKTYEVQDNGTLREVSSSSGGIIGALVDAATGLLDRATSDKK